jgi:hypothetical protein
MNKSIKLKNTNILDDYVGDRNLRVYRKGIDGRLSYTGLSKLVKRVTGNDPKVEEAYAFYLKNGDVVKILTKDHTGTNITEFHEGKARELKTILWNWA